MSERTTHSRRQLLRASIGAMAVIGFALSGAVSAIGGGGIDGNAGALSDGSLEPAVRIVPTTTIPSTILATIPARPPAGQILFPVDAQSDCGITDNFGDPRSSTRSHEGLDIMGSRGADLYAVASGRLTNKYVDSGLTYGAGNGWTLVDEVNNVTYKYFHMATHTAGLDVGDMVTFGQVIGTVGNTGTSGALINSNYHLHFEYRPGNVARDPRPLLARHPNCTFYG